MKTATKTARNSESPPLYSDDNAPPSGCQAKTALDLRTISEKAYLRVYPHCVEFSAPRGFHCKTDKPRTERGKIRGFSPRSRFRLFKTLAKVRESRTACSLFFTLTYHYGHNRSGSNCKGDLHHYLTRIRQYDSGIQYIWRLELQKRRAPHYHLIVFPSDYINKVGMEKYVIECSRIWHDIADPNSTAHERYGFRSETISSYKKACAYLAKYIAKADEYSNKTEIGRHWGTSQSMPYDCIEHYSLDRTQTRAIIERLRQYLIEIGKEQYASDIYFNAKRDQTVFIDHETWTQILREVPNVGFPDQ